MRKILVLVIIVLGVSLVAFRFSELQSIVQTLQNANSVYLMLAVMMQVVWFFIQAGAFRSLYRIMGIKEQLRHLVGVAVSANFINVIAPSGGIGGMAVFVDDADKRGHPHGRVVAVSALYIFLDYIAFLTILAAGFTVLLRRNSLNAGEISAGAILLLAVLVIGWLIFTGVRSPQQFGRVLGKIFRGVNSLLRPLLRRDYMHEDQAYLFAAEVADGLAVLQTEHKSLIRPILFLILNFMIQMVILTFCFLSFEVAFTLGTIVAGFAIGYLFLIVSPTPSGIGIVEGGLPIVLTSLHVPFEQGLIVTLAYRAVSFWMPLGLGAIAFRFSQRKRIKA
jgi:glycosyltransferase 2 family protein